jgi:hypothetical protein
MSDAPRFDPSKPFTVEVPKFDPSKPFTVEGAAAPAQKSSILDTMWGGAAPKPAAESGGGILDQIWTTPFIQRMREPNAGALDASKATGMQPAMERSAQISAEHPYQPGMTAGQMMRGRPEDPAAYGFSPGNLNRVGPMAPRNPAATARLQDFEGQGITPSLPAVGQGRATGLVAQAGRILPFSPIQRGIAQNTLETQAATERAASQYGTAADEFAGGNVARNAMTRFAADKSQALSDYNTFFGHMQGAPPAPIPNTVRVLSDFKGRFPNAPGLTDIFTSPPIMRMEQELRPRTVNIPGQTSPILNQFGQPTAVTPAQTVQMGGKLGMDELKAFRSKIGEQLEAPTIGPDSIPRGQLKQLYNALTQDMRAAAVARGPDAVRSLARAEGNYKIRMGIIDRLDMITNKDAPEAVFQALDRAATTGGGQDAGLLGAIKRTTTPDEWNDIGSAVIRRLGNPKPGVPRAPGEPDFSIGSVATNWRKLTPRAKDMLFGPERPGTPRAGLEELSRVAASLQNVSKLANTSHTAEVGAAFAMVGELFGSLAAGRVPIPELAAYTGAYGASKLLMSPAFSRWLYKAPSIINSAPAMMGNSLALSALGNSLAGRKEKRSEAQPLEQQIIEGRYAQPERDPDEPLRHSTGAL